MLKAPEIRVIFTPLAFLLALVRVRFMRGERRARLRARIEDSRRAYRRRAEIRQEAKRLGAEARIYEQLIRERLAGLGYMWTARYKYDRGKSSGSGRDKPVTFKVRFEKIFTTPEVIYLKLRVREKTLLSSRNALPHSVRVLDLINDETLGELSYACERNVTARHTNPRWGAWYLVHRLEGIGLLPEFVAWRDLLDHYPDDMGSLPWVMGVGARRTVHTICLSKHPHLLVAGPTGTGKSNAVNGFVCGLMYYTHPDNLKLTLIDLKEGVEFEAFKQAPHLFRPIVRNSDDALEALENMSKEIDRRLRLLRSTGVKDLPGYNAISGERLPYLLTIIDEYAQLVLPVDKSVRDEANRLVVRCSALGRAAGCQVIVCTQYPTKEVIDPQIKINLNLKVAFRTQNSTQSMVILADPRAADLPMTPGRAIYSLGPDVLEVQVGLVKDEDIAHVLKVARGRAAGITAVRGKEISLIPAGAARYIARELGGDLSKGKLQAELGAFGVDRLQVGRFLDDLPKLDGYGVAADKLISLNPDPELDQAQAVIIAPEPEPPDPEPEPEPEPIIAPALPISARADFEAKFRECFVIDEQAITPIAELHTAYVAAVGDRYTPLNRSNFAKQLKALGFERKRMGDTKGTNAWRGLRVRGTEEPPSDATGETELSDLSEEQEAA